MTTANKTRSYLNQLRLLNILLLSLFLQLNDELLLSKFTHGKRTDISLLERRKKRKKVKSSNFGRHDHRKQKVSSFSGISDSSIDCTTISTSWVWRTEDHTSKFHVEICQKSMLSIKRVHLAALLRLPTCRKQWKKYRNDNWDTEPCI